MTGTGGHPELAVCTHSHILGLGSLVSGCMKKWHPQMGCVEGRAVVSSEGCMFPRRTPMIHRARTHMQFTSNRYTYTREWGSDMSSHRGTRSRKCGSGAGASHEINAGHHPQISSQTLNDGLDVNNCREAEKVPDCNPSGRCLLSSWSVLSSAQDSEELGEVDTNLIRKSRRKWGKFLSPCKAIYD